MSYTKGMTTTAAHSFGDIITGVNDSGTWTGKVIEIIEPGSRFSRWDQKETRYRIDGGKGWLHIVTPMNLIQITGAELAPGDEVDGETIATVEVRRSKTYVTYEGDDTPIRVSDSQVYTVHRLGGVSTVEEPEPVRTGTDWAAVRRAEIEAGARREHELQLSFRRDRYRVYGRS